MDFCVKGEVPPCLCLLAAGQRLFRRKPHLRGTDVRSDSAPHIQKEANQRIWSSRINRTPTATDLGAPRTSPRSECTMESLITCSGTQLPTCSSSESEGASASSAWPCVQRGSRRHFASEWCDLCAGVRCTADSWFGSGREREWLVESALRGERQSRVG